MIFRSNHRTLKGYHQRRQTLAGYLRTKIHLGDYAYIDPQTGGRVTVSQPVYSPAPATSIAVAPALKQQFLECQRIGGRWTGSSCVPPIEMVRDEEVVRYPYDPLPPAWKPTPVSLIDLNRQIELSRSTRPPRDAISEDKVQRALQQAGYVPTGIPCVGTPATPGNACIGGQEWKKPVPASGPAPNGAAGSGLEEWKTKITDWFTGQTVISGVPNWALLAGAALAAYGLKSNGGGRKRF